MTVLTRKMASCRAKRKTERHDAPQVILTGRPARAQLGAKQGERHDETDDHALQRAAKR